MGSPARIAAAAIAAADPFAATCAENDPRAGNLAGRAPRGTPRGAAGPFPSGAAPDRRISPREEWLAGLRDAAREEWLQQLRAEARDRRARETARRISAWTDPLAVLTGVVGLLLVARHVIPAVWP